MAGLGAAARHRRREAFAEEDGPNLALGPEHPTDELIGVGTAPFYYLPHTQFVATRGLAHFALSMRAQYELTKRFSAESSIRPVIAADPERTLATLRQWARDPNAHVRRLVSEGTRLRLPWAMRVQRLDTNPERVLELLDLLKDDPALLVRRKALGRPLGRCLVRICRRARHKPPQAARSAARADVARDLANGVKDGYLNPLGTGSDEEDSHGHVPDAL